MRKKVGSWKIDPTERRLYDSKRIIRLKYKWQDRYIYIYIYIYIYDKEYQYFGCYPKKYLLENSGVLDEKVKSFKIDDNDLYIQLDF